MICVHFSYSGINLLCSRIEKQLPVDHPEVLKGLLIRGNLFYSYSSFSVNQIIRITFYFINQMISHVLKEFIAL